MILRAFGEVLTDILTINPAMRLIPSASAILDTSNFTFQAMTFGKDAEGFTHHSHVISSLAGDVYNNGILIITRYNSTSPSSYHSSATHAVFSSTYNSVPNYPSIYDTRLERGSTITNILGTSDVGHYLNVAIDDAEVDGIVLSSMWNVIGGFAPSSDAFGDPYTYHFVNSAGVFQFSGLLSSTFNTHGTMDKNGFLRFTNLNGSDANAATDWSGMAKVTANSTISAVPAIQVAICIHQGDAASLAAFGGLNHIGVYCLDLQQMLNDGLRPPFAWNYLNNSRKYKLVAKNTFWKDLLYHIDATDPNAIAGLAVNGGPPSGYKSLLEIGLNTFYPTNKGPAYVFTLNFT